jgi:hypothetical protein
LKLTIFDRNFVAGRRLELRIRGHVLPFRLE